MKSISRGVSDENMIKDKVYKTAPATLNELRGRINEEVENITSDTCKKVFSNLIKRWSVPACTVKIKIFQWFPNFFLLILG